VEVGGIDVAVVIDVGIRTRAVRLRVLVHALTDHGEIHRRDHAVAVDVGARRDHPASTDGSRDRRKDPNQSQ
jgi:hypothetical protein